MSADFQLALAMMSWIDTSFSLASSSRRRVSPILGSTFSAVLSFAMIADRLQGHQGLPARPVEEAVSSTRVQDRQATNGRFRLVVTSGRETESEWPRTCRLVLYWLRMFLDVPPASFSAAFSSDSGDMIAKQSLPTMLGPRLDVVETK